MKIKAVNIEIPSEALNDLCRRYQVRELALFGSVLRDDFRPDSDIDILVTFAPTAKIGFIAFNQMQRELSTLLQRPVDLVPKQGLKPVIKQDVLVEAQVIYAA